jgi:hypothetical protein
MEINIADDKGRTEQKGALAEIHTANPNRIALEQ